MKILFITNNLPYPPILGERLRNYNILKRIGEKHELYLIVTSYDGSEEKYIPEVEKFCKKACIIKIPDFGALDKPIEWVKFLFKGIPPDLRMYYSPDLEKKIKEWLVEIDFDIVNVDHSYMAIYWEVINQYSKAKTILTFHDILWVNYQRIYPMEKKLLRKIRLWFHSYMLKKWEPKIVRKFNQVITVSEDEKQLLLDENPDLQIDVVFNGVDTKLLLPLPETKQTSKLLFVGDMDYLPNVDAMVFFVDEIFPLIKDQVQDVEMWIVGMSPSQKVLDLQGDGVIVTGRVEDIIPYYQQSKVCVVPLRAGSGTRLKIVEAMALGRVVVSTTLGAEGIDMQDGVNIAIADSPEKFAERTIELLTDNELRKQQIQQGRAFVENHYEWDVVVKKVNSIIEKYQDYH